MVNFGVSLKIDRNKSEHKSLNKDLRETEKNSTAASKGMSSLTKSMIALAVPLTAVSAGFAKIFSDGMKVNIQMEALELRIRALTASSASYTTVSGRKVSAMEREVLITKKAQNTMMLLEVANKKTAFNMADLTDVFATMTPAATNANVSMKDQIDILVLLSNTAANASLGSDQLTNGIDDLFAGTVKANSGFGKMLSQFGVSIPALNKMKNKVGELKNKLNESGKANTGYATTISNIGVAYDGFVKKLTKPVFETYKKSLQSFGKAFDEAIKVNDADITNMMLPFTNLLIWVPKAKASILRFKVSFQSVLESIGFIALKSFATVVSGFYGMMASFNSGIAKMAQASLSARKGILGMMGLKVPEKDITAFDNNMKNINKKIDGYKNKQKAVNNEILDLDKKVFASKVEVANKISKINSDEVVAVSKAKKVQTELVLELTKKNKVNEKGETIGTNVNNTTDEGTKKTKTKTGATKENTKATEGGTAALQEYNDAMVQINRMLGNRDDVFNAELKADVDQLKSSGASTEDVSSYEKEATRKYYEEKQLQQLTFQAKYDDQAKLLAGQIEINKAVKEMEDLNMEGIKIDAVKLRMQQELIASQNTVLGGLTKYMLYITEAAKDYGKLTFDIFKSLENSLSDGLMKVLDTTSSKFLDFKAVGKDVLKSLLQDLQKVLIKMVAMQAMSAIFGGPGGATGGGGIVNLITSAFANGGAFVNGTQKFANGGAFDGGVQKFATGGIVSSPTNFNMGLMGEAGPEAIMPLTRIGGDLGVRTTSPKITINNNNGSRIRTEERNGQTILTLEDVDAHLSSQMANGTGQFNTTMNAAYKMKRI